MKPNRTNEKNGTQKSTDDLMREFLENGGKVKKLAIWETAPPRVRTKNPEKDSNAQVSR